MCGVVGVIAGFPIEPAAVVRMRDTLAHRGPDHAGLWASDDGTVCLGHRRLAIIDLNPNSNQPFRSNDDRYVLTFNGEIYNYRTLRGHLESRGVIFRTQSDTEVLLEAFRYWGEDCLDRLSGMFAFAIWDIRERTLFCARDRVGEKPFYYGLIDGSFIFGSEVKALLEWPGMERSLSWPAVADYLTFGFVPDPKCIWEGLRKLPPGHSMRVRWREGRSPIVLDPCRFWDLEFETDTTVRDWKPLFRDALENAANEMAVADVPVGVFLSGGVDSSSVTAALRRTGHEPRTFSIGFTEESYDERKWARIVADRYDTVHTERVVGRDDIGPVLKRLVWHYDEPFNDYSYIPTFYLCREARESITVALSGDGADELFAGYPKYQRLGLRNELGRFVPAGLASAVAGVATHGLPEASRFRRALLQHGRRAPEALADTVVLGFQEGALRKAARGPLAEALKHYSPRDVVLELLRRAPPAEVGLVNASRYLDLKLTLAGDILVKVDRASMAVSLEVRPVYLHRELLDLAARVPPELLAGRNHSKGVLKDALQPWLPNSLLYRKKMGFALPLGHWVGGGDVNPLLSDGESGAIDELLDPHLLDELSRNHSRGRVDHTPRIHSLYFFRHWLERWLA